jgi:hypothetical protein
MRPRTRVRQSLNERAFKALRINATTADSLSPNCSSIASNGVSSCQAMAMMADASASANLALGSDSLGMTFMKSRFGFR